jgi:hypothetical protein
VPQQQKTRRQLAKMIARRLRPFKVRVASVQRNRDGSWHAITYGSQAAVERVQPRVDAIVAKLSASYQLNDASNPAASPSAKWLAWARGRRFKRRKSSPGAK